MRASDNLFQISEVSTISRLILDIFPPSKVTDLNAELLNENAQITFTAPGDDFNEGIGTKLKLQIEY